MKSTESREHVLFMMSEDTCLDGVGRGCQGANNDWAVLEAWEGGGCTYDCVLQLPE